MAHYGRFRLANARTTGAKALSDNFDCVTISVNVLLKS